MPPCIFSPGFRPRIRRRDCSCVSLLGSNATPPRGASPVPPHSSPEGVGRPRPPAAPRRPARAHGRGDPRRHNGTGRIVEMCAVPDRAAAVACGWRGKGWDARLDGGPGGGVRDSSRMILPSGFGKAVAKCPHPAFKINCLRRACGLPIQRASTVTARRAFPVRSFLPPFTVSELCQTYGAPVGSWGQTSSWARFASARHLDSEGQACNIDWRWLGTSNPASGSRQAGGGFDSHALPPAWQRSGRWETEDGRRSKRGGDPAAATGGFSEAVRRPWP